MTTAQPTTALVLIGHGSHISPNTAGLVWRYADLLRQRRAADEVTAAFWKEQPSISEVLDTLTADDITIIPVFTAQGYFTQSVIPAELGLNKNGTTEDTEFTEQKHRAGRIIRYGKTPGEHGDLAGIIQKRVEDALNEYGLDAAQTTIGIVGHGTRRHKDSRLATRQQMRILTERGIAHAVIDGYLDDEPDIPSLYSRAETPTLVVVPFFLAPGSHVTIDVPHALGLPEGARVAELHGKTVYYTDPIGTDETLTQMILDLAHEAGMPNPTLALGGDGRGMIYHAPTGTTTSSVGTHNAASTTSAWAHFPAAGGRALIDHVLAEGEIVVGELRITPEAVTHVNVSEHPARLDHPQTLRAHLRDEPFRPLASARDLPRDWVAPVTKVEDIPAIVETIYPGVVVSLAKALPVTPLMDVIGRQQGNFRVLSALNEADIDHVVETVCVNCVKCPVWHHADKPDNAIPCREACNLWLSAALESLELREEVA